jgi:hypothetical protein
MIIVFYRSILRLVVQSENYTFSKGTPNPDSTVESRVINYTAT